MKLAAMHIVAQHIPPEDYALFHAAADVLVKIPLLAFQRIRLVEIVGGHTAIGGDPLDLIVEWIGQF